jgi:putative endonuclease
MFYVYILFSNPHQKTYVGFTSNLEARLTAHNHPKNKGWTKRHMPWVCIRHETFSTKSEAMTRELWFKSGLGRRWIAEKLLK